MRTANEKLLQEGRIMSSFTTINISMDGIWAGSGKLRNGIIEDCGAQFCDDNDESLAAYGLIESAIANGKAEIALDIDGQSRRLTWSIVKPME